MTVVRSVHLKAHSHALYATHEDARKHLFVPSPASAGQIIKQEYLKKVTAKASYINVLTQKIPDPISIDEKKLG